MSLMFNLVIAYFHNMFSKMQMIPEGCRQVDCIDHDLREN